MLTRPARQPVARKLFAALAARCCHVAIACCVRLSSASARVLGETEKLMPESSRP